MYFLERHNQELGRAKCSPVRSDLSKLSFCSSLFSLLEWTSSLAWDAPGHKRLAGRMTQCPLGSEQAEMLKECDLGRGWVLYANWCVLSRWLFSFHFTILSLNSTFEVFTYTHSFSSFNTLLRSHFTVTMTIFLCLDQRHTFHSLCLSL